MNVERGKHRLVFVPVGGFAIKIANIRLSTFVKEVKTSWKKGVKFLYINLTRKRNNLGVVHPFDAILCGVENNWREYWFYVRCPNPLLQPTVFTLVGFINVQPAGEPCSLTREELEKLLESALGDDRFMDDSHHFVNPKNFVITKSGSFRMVDYGDPKTQILLSRHWKEILEVLGKADEGKRSVKK